jgi:hypothetical protein
MKDGKHGLREKRETADNERRDEPRKVHVGFTPYFLIPKRDAER